MIISQTIMYSFELPLFLSLSLSPSLALSFYTKRTIKSEKCEKLDAIYIRPTWSVTHTVERITWFRGTHISQSVAFNPPECGTNQKVSIKHEPCFTTDRYGDTLTPAHEYTHSFDSSVHVSTPFSALYRSNSCLYSAHSDTPNRSIIKRARAHTHHWINGTREKYHNYRPLSLCALMVSWCFFNTDQLFGLIEFIRLNKLMC